MGAFAVILDEGGRFLLAHRRNYDLWNLPGGGVEPGEAPWDAVMREVREETGLEVIVERLAGLYSWPAAGDLLFSFVCAVVGGHLTERAETAAVRFFAPERLPPNTFAEHRERVSEALHVWSVALLRAPICLSAPEEIRRWRALGEQAQEGGAR